MSRLEVIVVLVLLLSTAGARASELRFVEVEIVEAATGVPLPRGGVVLDNVIHTPLEDHRFRVPLLSDQTVEVGIVHLGYLNQTVMIPPGTDTIVVALRPHPEDPFLLHDRHSRLRWASEPDLPIMDTPIERVPARREMECSLTRRCS